MTSQKSIDNKQIVSRLTSNRSGKMKSYIAILLVSVGKENFEGEAINSALKMINQEFKGCCIAVADTLQRYNIASEKGITAEEAYDESLARGDVWLEQYQPYFAATFEIPFEILRWDSLLQDVNFEKKAQNFSLCLQSNPVLEEAMEHSIEEYGQRLRKRLSDDYFSQIQSRYEKNCLSYLREECVALTLIPKNIKLSDEGDPVVIVYPGKSTSILTENREIFIKSEFNELFGQYSDFLNWLPYRFNKIAQVKQDVALDTQLKINSVENSKEAHLVLARVEHIKSLSEVQLNSICITLDHVSNSIFETCVLDYLLNIDDLICKYPDQPGEQAAFTIKLLAEYFAIQMMSMFDTLDRKYANQCRANLIKILKKKQSICLSLKRAPNAAIQSSYIK